MALSIRKPSFQLQQTHFNEVADAAIKTAVEHGRVICEIAPVKFWVQTDTRQDEWADYVTCKGKIIWSKDRINDILSKADVRDSFNQVTFLTSYEGIKWMISKDTAQFIIEKTAKESDINLNGSFYHGPGYSSSTDVSITWDTITSDSRHGIGN